MAKFSDLDTGKRLRAKAARHGATARILSDGRIAFSTIEWNIAGNCAAPVLVQGAYRAYGYVHVSHKGKPVTLHTEIETRCRRCDQCLAARAYMWSQRAMLEVRRSTRTWLVTLTFTPEEQHRALARARSGIDAQGVQFELLPRTEQFDLHVRELTRHATLFLKRLRKGIQGSTGRRGDTATWEHPPALFRYLLVAEPHKSGQPHFHVLLHELDELRPVRQKAIYAAWKSGFASAKLVNEGAAMYMTKYTVKTLGARVRASIAYGTDTATASAIASTKVKRAV